MKEVIQRRYVNKALERYCEPNTKLKINIIENNEILTYFVTNIHYNSKIILLTRDAVLSLHVASVFG